MFSNNLLKYLGIPIDSCAGDKCIIYGFACSQDLILEDIFSQGFIITNIVDEQWN